MPNTIQRIPLTSPIATRDGVLCHDSKVVNAWIESPDQEDYFVTKRYGFTTAFTLAGTSIGQGIFGFLGNHYTIFDDIIYRNGVSPITLSVTVPDLIFRFEAAPPASGLTGFFFKSKRDAFFYNTTALTSTKITDPDYPNVTVPGVAWLNGRFFVSTNQGRIHNCDLNNPFSWSALAIISAVADSDTPIAITRLRNYIMVLKEFSTEFFFDAGTAPPASPLKRVDSAFVEVGCSADESVINTDTSVFFLGKTKRTRGGKVYKCEGYTPSKISTDFVEKIIDGDNLSNVRAFSYSPQGKDFYVLQLFNSERTLVFDVELNAWYVWASKELQTTKTVLTLTRRDDAGVQFVAVATVLGHGYEDGDLVIHAGASPTTYNGTFTIRYINANQYEYVLATDPLVDATVTGTARGFNLKAFPPSGYITTADQDFFQDRVNGKIYTSTVSNLTDDGLHIDYRVMTKIHDFGNTNTKTFSRIEPIGDKNLYTSNLLIRYSDNDYQSFSPFRKVNLNDDRPQLRALGNARRRAWEVRNTDPSAVRLMGLELEFVADGLT